MNHRHICLKSQVLTSTFTTTKVRSAEELFSIEKMAAKGLGSKKMATTLGMPQSTTKRWLEKLRSDGETVSHNVGGPRGEEAGVCVCVLFSFVLIPHLSNCA